MNHRAIRLGLLFSVFGPASSSLSLLHGQDSSPSRWTVSLNGGFALTRLPQSSPDIIYQDGLQAVVRLDVGHRLVNRVTLGLEAQIAREAGMGDCVTSSSCGRHLEYDALSALLAFKPARGIPLLSAGVGLYRLPRSFVGPTPRTDVVGLHLGTEFPLIRINQDNWFSVGLRGMLLPDPPGPSIYSIDLLVGFRHWLREGSTR